jgi:hypothetical protein
MCTHFSYTCVSKEAVLYNIFSNYISKNFAQSVRVYAYIKYGIRSFITNTKFIKKNVNANAHRTIELSLHMKLYNVKKFEDINIALCNFN